jgi:hypothetical protein
VLAVAPQLKAQISMYALRRHLQPEPSLCESLGRRAPAREAGGRADPNGFPGRQSQALLPEINDLRWIAASPSGRNRIGRVKPFFAQVAVSAARNFMSSWRTIKKFTNQRHCVSRLFFHQPMS